MKLAQLTRNLRTRYAWADEGDILSARYLRCRTTPRTDPKGLDRTQDTGRSGTYLTILKESMVKGPDAMSPVQLWLKRKEATAPLCLKNHNNTGAHRSSLNLKRTSSVPLKIERKLLFSDIKALKDDLWILPGKRRRRKSIRTRKTILK